MTTVRTTIRTLTAARNVARLLAALALAVALVAIPAVTPDEAGAMRMSERLANRACYNAGGTMHIDFLTSDLTVFNMTCTLPSGAQFTCISSGSPFGNMVDC
jgi:hypothetical protein